MTKLRPGQLVDLCRVLVARGWWVTAAEETPETVIIGFNFMPHAVPAWLKAFEVSHEDTDVAGVEAAIARWKAGVRVALENGGASDTVRLMVAEHGPGAVREAMREKLVV